MRLQDEIEIPVSAKTTMEDEDKKFREEETISLKCAIRSAFNLSPNSLEFATRVATLSRWGRDEIQKNRIICASKKSLV